jgi:hypothetical protein
MCLLLIVAACSSRTTSTTITTPAPTESEPALISTPWRLLREASKMLVVLAAAGGCLEFDHMAVDEDESTVTLTALGRSQTPEERADGTQTTCTTELSLEVAAACLKAPLGDRELVHAPISPGREPKSIEDISLPPKSEQREPKEPCPE